MSETTPVQQRPATTLPPKYTPAEVEGSLYQRWVDRGYFATRSDSAREPFSVVIPPPNVTGSLHIGHALDHTIQDIVIRRQRMLGRDVLWLPGMDHAGIATQNVVERELRKDGLTRHDLGREAFVAKVWEWKEHSGGKILGQMRRLGDSVDWSRERFTMDAGLSRAVQTIFKRLYDDELIYRAERIINWCPRCHTALSDIEVDHHDDEGELVELVYGDLGGGDRVVVATTRVETMLGDTAIAVNPEDERYARLVGREIELPLVGRRIPVVADDHVDPEFGTGAVKVTPAHDPNDFEIGQRHGVPAISIMTPEGVITGTGTSFDGMDRFAAREAVREALRAQGRVGVEKRPYLHAVGHCSRCETVVEPRLSLQWFVSVEPLAKAAGDAVRDGRVRIHPKDMEPRWFGWVDDMHDWCISRQLWWGHRIPVWYGPNGEVVCLGPDETLPGAAGAAAPNQPGAAGAAAPNQPGAAGAAAPNQPGAAADGAPPEGWTQDPDVLDTWFSSALWPFSTLGWPVETADLRRFYPTSVLVTGYDILFFWVARMMMFGLYAMDGVQPFDTVALHGLVRDRFGKKMSKSRGNVVDPLEWMDRYGADALRFTLARGANPGSDQAISEEWAAGSRNFCTKLWNAARFALLNGATVEGGLPGSDEQSVVDRWILSRLATITVQADAGYADFQFAKTTEALYHFVWDEVCDWYLELAKLPLAAGGRAADTTRRVLGEVLDVVLRLLHPVVPFVTDALWTQLTGGESLVVAAWPTPGSPDTGSPSDAVAGSPSDAVAGSPSDAVAGSPSGVVAGLPFDAAAETEVAALQRLVTEVRRFRAEQGLKPGQAVAGRVTGLDRTGLAAHEGEVRALARLDDAGDGFAASATLRVGEVTVELDLRGAIDVEAERKRLEKDLGTAQRELGQAQIKLNNEQFLAKAPEEVVAKIRERLVAAEAEVSRLEAALGGLPVV